MIIFNIDVMLARRKMSVTELSRRVGITMANISILKNGKARAVRVETLDRLCRALDCQPGDILEFDAAGFDGLAVDLTECFHQRLFFHSLYWRRKFGDKVIPCRKNRIGHES